MSARIALLNCLTVVIVAYCGMFLVSPASAQELRIGHLETHDDTGINWLFFHCFQQGSSLECDVFQTLITHELEAAQRAADLEKTMRGNTGDAVKEFPQAFGDMCKNIGPIVAAAQNAVRTGRGANGKPVNSRQAEDAQRMFSLMSAACQNPNKDTVQRWFEFMADEKIKTCQVYNEYSHMKFNYDAATQSWISQEGPVGPCGSFNVSTLKRDPKTQSFWNYTEKKIRTNLSGVLQNGMTCAQLKDYTLNYTWRADNSWQDCEHIKNMMN
ncbi:MAG TPA: hypothetical protein VIJ52_07010 [Pseudolabrys sp.]